MDTQERSENTFVFSVITKRLRASDYCEACETKEFKKLVAGCISPALGLLVALVLSIFAINNTARALL